MLIIRLIVAVGCTMIAVSVGAQGLDANAAGGQSPSTTPVSPEVSGSSTASVPPSGAPVAAQAQPEPSVPAPAAAHSETSSAPASLAEVVVTATKRSARAQDVPAAVTVVDGAQLKNLNITDVAGVTQAAPSVTAINNSAGAVMQIRGIGSVAFSRTSESSVGIVLDGVALANASLGSPPLFDIAQVEVLEGPQGTLYGRNSSAGIVNITTVAPDPRAVSLSLHSDIGTRDSAIVYGTFNLPVTDYSALRMSAGYTKAPHDIYNAYQGSWDDANTYEFRSRYRWEPNEKWTINLIGDFSQNKLSGGSPWAVYQATPGSALSNDLAQCGVTPGPDNSTSCTDGTNISTSKAYGFSGQVDYDLGWATASSISAYRRLLNYQNSDSDSIQENVLNTNYSSYDIRNLSQEFRLSSQGKGAFQYVAGLYYFNGRIFDTGGLEGKLLGFLPPPLGTLDPILLGQYFMTGGNSRSYAAYEESTLRILPSLRAILGLRYGHENVSASTRSQVAPGAVAAFESIAPVDGATTDNYVSYRFGLQYDLTKRIMSYATFSRGYKGPAINDQSGGGSAPLVIKPEIPMAWETGIKSRLFHNTLQVNLAVFDARYANFQSQFFDPSLAAFIYGNAPKVTTKGVELSILGRLSQNWAVNFGALYNDAKYGKGYLVTCSQGQTAAQGCMSTGAAGTTKVTDAGGNRLVGAPLWKLTAQSEYHYELSPAMEAFLNGDVVYTSRINFDQAYDPADSVGSHVLLGLRTGLRSPEEKWGASIYVRNVLDQRVPSYRLPNPVGYPFETDPASYVQLFGPESFRTFGLSFDVKF